MKYLEKVERRPDPDVRYPDEMARRPDPDEVGCRADPNVRYPDEVGCRSDIITAVRHPGGMSNVAHHKGAICVCKGKRATWHFLGRIPQ